jgi:hypothetical protein
VDQTEPENQNFHGNIQQRGVEPDLDSPVRVPPVSYLNFKAKSGSFCIMYSECYNSTFSPEEI